MRSPHSFIVVFSMSIDTQFNPQAEHDRRLIAAGASKTVYALVTPEMEATKAAIFGKIGLTSRDLAWALYLQQFREAWNGKQLELHQIFFETWLKWSAPMIECDPGAFPFRYPTAGASEALYHLIADYGNQARVHGFQPSVHIFYGDYEGYKAYAEACGVRIVHHARKDWRSAADAVAEHELTFFSQPSAIDGDIWPDANAFLLRLAGRSERARAVVDFTYVGATAHPPAERFAAGLPSVKAFVLSLSKPFGAYYDRIGGVFCRTEDLGLFGNQWFKNLTSLQLGVRLMTDFDVFAMALRYGELQKAVTDKVGDALGLSLRPSDVFILASADPGNASDPVLAAYLRRPQHDPTARPRLCLTPAMAGAVGTAGPVIEVDTQ
jgi:hypothetical protein